MSGLSHNKPRVEITTVYAAAVLISRERIFGKVWWTDGWLTHEPELVS